MPRGKRRVISDIAKKSKETQIQLSIEDRLAGCGRNEPEHIKYVGYIVENMLKSEAGAIIKALTAGRISMELESAKTSEKTSDWHLGRASMGNDLWNDLEQFVLDKDKLQKPDEYEGVQSFNYSPEII